MTVPPSTHDTALPTYREIELPSNPAGPEAGVAQPAQVHEMLAQLSSGRAPAVLDQLQEAGINIDRWVSPNLLGQMRQAVARRPEFVLCGAIDLDPAVPLQRTLAAERAMEVAAGAAALGKLLGTPRVLLAVPEDMAASGVAALRAAAQAACVRLFPLMERYPLAQPSLLIHHTTGRRLVPGKLPTEAGVLVLDAPAAIAIARCLMHGEPMRRVPLGIYDETHSRTHLLRVPVGATLGEILSMADIPAESAELWAGHVLRHVPVSKEATVGCGELTFFISAPRLPEAPAACLRCGWCVEACPVRIQPAGLLDAAQQNDPQLAEQYGLRSCIDCGICSYVCPSRLPLQASIRALRAAR